MIQIDYTILRPALKNGDVVAFGGTSVVSTIIKTITKSNVSHVGIIIKTSPGFGNPIIQIIESTSLEDTYSGVQISRLSHRINTYNGSVWILPLDDYLRTQLDVRAYLKFILSQNGKPYDYFQAFHSHFDKFFPDTPMDLSRLFCSELVTAGLQAGGLDHLSELNPSEQTPINVVNFPIYDEVYQVAGKLLDLR